MKIFNGEVHAHTNHSDGRGTPEEAYDYARNVGKVDYFSVTDHNFGKFTAERFYSVMPALAEEKNEDGKFAALYGYEMTYGAPSGYYGHANIIPPKEIFWTKLSLDEWYDEMARIGETGVGQFNHPGDKWGNFNDFKYDPRMDNIFSIMEIRITEYGISCIEEEYDRALRMGWHISPVSNEDTHGANWTTSREETGAVLAEELTRENILDGMRKNRTYATTDRSFKLFYKANGEWIGSRLKKTGSLKVEIDATTEKDCGIGVLQLVGEHNIVLAQVDAGKEKSFHWEITIPDDQRYTYVKRISGMQYAISGAIFVEQDAPVEVEIQTNYQNKKLVAVADVKNLGDEDVEDITVSWYPACMSIERKSKPFVSHLDDLGAGKSARAAYTSPIRPRDTRLVVAVRGTYKGQPIAVNKVVYLSALTITQFFTNTKSNLAQGYTKQPFCCFDIFNQTDASIDISKYQFRIYNCGLHQEFRIPKKIKAHQTLTVWLRGKSGSNTLDDFNAYYGTSLTKDDVYICAEKFGAEDATRKLAICYGDEVICRAYVRGDGYHGADVQPQGCFRYAWNQNCATLDVLELREKAMPQEKFIYEPATLELPKGKALAKYEEAAEKEINRLVVFTDGCSDLVALEAKAREIVPEAKEIVMIAGENDGTKGLHSYMFHQDEKLINDALDANPDAILVAIGANDCGRKRLDWFSRNFVSFSTVAVNMTRGFYVHNIPLLFTTSIMTEEQKVDENALVHNIKMVADTLGGKIVGMPEEIIPKSEIIEIDKIVPREDAVRVAVIGDQFSEGNSETAPYASIMQSILGDGYDVRIYSKIKARAAYSNVTNYLRGAEAVVKEMKKFKPDIIVSWFGLSDLSRENSAVWDEYKPDFIKGYDELIETLGGWGAKIIMIAPFLRTIDDVRRAVILQEGGMKDTVIEIAKAHGLPLVDFFTPTSEQAGLIVVRKKIDTISKEGTELLAKMVAEEIGK
ncbi:MAG: CehA/McbA family metallohydrolase [Clostridia bacterium]|nr:CehA/McbA family metallohydrolase [Clostridia bacterium]